MRQDAYFKARLHLLAYDEFRFSYLDLEWVGEQTHRRQTKAAYRIHQVFSQTANSSHLNEK